MVERVPAQHLEGISVSARRDMAERTVQVITNGDTLRNIRRNYNETTGQEIENTFALYTICLETKFLFVFISTLPINRNDNTFFVFP